MLLRRTLTLGLIALGSACGGADGLHHTQPKALVEDKVDFGVVPAGATKIIEVPVSNLGESPLNVCITQSSRRCAGLTRVVPDNGVFTAVFDGVDPKTGRWPVAVGQDGTRAKPFQLHFTPPEKVAFQAVLELVDESSSEAAVVEIHGSGTDPKIKVTPETIDFGTINTSDVQKVTITLENADDFDQPFEIQPVASDSRKLFPLVNSGADPAQADGNPVKGLVPAHGKATADLWYVPTTDGDNTLSISVSYCPYCTKAIPVHGASWTAGGGGGGGRTDRPQPDRSHEGHGETGHNPS